MGVPKPVEKEEAAEELHGLYDAMFSNFGRMPNLFGVMARFPAALKRFLPFYRAVMQKGRLPAKLKELAYLKTASINACRY
jgi:alkylhydroperoxidase family enzyme